MTEDITSEIEIFAALLEKAGLKQESPGDKSALVVVHDELWPLAQRTHISLLHAALAYADQDAEQDPAEFQLFHALRKIPRDELKRPGLNERL